MATVGIIGRDFQMVPGLHLLLYSSSVNLIRSHKVSSYPAFTDLKVDLCV